MLHGIVCDGQGRKMSKSLGNVIDPLHVINGRSVDELEEDLKASAGNLMNDKELQKSLKSLKTMLPNGIPKCGTDAFRFSLIHNDPKSQQLNMDVRFVSTCSAFCNKIWQLTRFFLLSHEKKQTDEMSSNVDEIRSKNIETDFSISNNNELKPEDKWILSKCALAVRDINSHFESRDFHLIARCLRSFIYNNLCDVYVELAKTALNNPADPEFKIKYKVLKLCLETGLKLLHPVMPFITEEIYQRIGTLNNSLSGEILNQSIMVSQYPCYEEWSTLVSYDTLNDMDILLELIASIRNCKAMYDLKRSNRPKVLIEIEQGSLFENHNPIKDYCSIISVLSPCGGIDIVERKVNLTQTDNYIDQLQTWSCTELPQLNCTVYINVAEYIDVSKELEKLHKQRSKALKDIDAAKNKNKYKETVLQEKLDEFDAIMKRINDKEHFLNLLK